MTIDDRLRRAGQQFRDDHPTPAPVALTPATTPRRASRTRTPRRRVIGIATAVLALAALTVGVVAWVDPSGTSPRPASAADELTSADWKLVSASSGGAALTPLAALDLHFDAGSGRVDIGDGCVGTAGRFTVDGAQVQFTDLVTAVGSCPPSDRAANVLIAEVFVDGSVAWEVTDDRLTLTRGTASLTYALAATSAEAAPLTAHGWELTAALGAGGALPVPADTRTPLELHVDEPTATITTSDGCNTTVGPVVVGHGRVVIVSATSSAVGCIGPGADLRSALADVYRPGTAAWAVTGGRLTVTRGTTTLTYTRTAG